MHVTRFYRDLEMQDLQGFPSHNPRSRLEACEKESFHFPRRAPGTSVASREIAALASREATTWGSEAVGSCTLPSGASLNPGVWLMQLTQLTALLVQCWSFCKKG